MSLSAETFVDLTAESMEVEVGKVVPLSCRVDSGKTGFPQFVWKTTGGEIRKSAVEGEVDFIAPRSSGTVSITVDVTIGGNIESRMIDLTILPEGALKKTADILITVDTKTLQNVWVNSTHKSENFKAPLSIKGTFRYDPDSELAFAGGSWPTYPMYDDGTHGDVTAGDGIWSILMKFEKTDSKVYFAFDDGNSYRVEYESGLAWTVKMAWIELDEYPDDHSNPAFTPDKDKTISWTASMAEEGGIYSER
ncbi:choice-of-anchor X domain-containing protein [Spirochaeta isovalerica]|uniref:Uncharacterized protein n=1 Tax=Spirochaeta isovalerica TaxID=150 RepID=A0A841R3T8_9SPIO|nr:choice-of-anchor X domain-containing protein [Spirochaeta isovalerica]MBB6478463.1 hypothetical protein [Spirochaeta isovalerica]